MQLLLRRNVLAALIPSALIYLAARWTGTSLPGYPEGHVWTFNPLDWQLLFVIGAAFGHSSAMGQAPLRRNRFFSGIWPFRIACAVAAAGFVIKLSWTLHENFNAVPTLLSHILLPMNKSVLPLVRLADVLALAFLVGRLISRDAAFFRTRVAWLVVLCGQNSLQVFCLSILLSVMGNVAFTVFGDAAGMQAVVNASGIAMLLAMGLLMAWFNAGGRLPRPPVTEGDV